MWLTVLLLALALNLEPTRIGLVPLLLTREKPLLQLLAFLAGNLTVSFGFGLLVLFVLHRNPFGSDNFSGGQVQTAVGLVVLVIAAILAARWLAVRRRKVHDTGGSDPSAQPGSRPIHTFTNTVRQILRKGRSPWLAALVGTGAGLPSVDYMAVLAIIATSQAAPPEQAAALLSFILVGSLVVLAPLLGFLMAPAATLRLVNGFGAWIRARSQIEYALLLAAVGCLLIVLGQR